MQTVSRGGVEFDMCPTCRGVWLDRGELERLLSGEKEEREQSVQQHGRFEREVESFHRDPDAWRRSHPYDDREKRHRYDSDNYGQRKKKKFDLFDIFD